MSKNCVNCGETVKKTDVFCPFCGANTDAVSSSGKDSESQYSEQNILYCSKCNAKNKLGAQFCEFCGSEIVSESYKSSAGSSSTGTDRASEYQKSQTYGSYSSEPSDSENRKWYTPPKRTRSAKHPAEWFFWSCWGIFIIFRAIFQVLWIILRIAACAKGR